ncbi:MAG: type II toxin-antitoxin system death-on-curing family toxin [Deltaproteobacteria bacterium]|nr:type II toxin-antitoxin system death-on-curing family toxin [Deltaproteobacteria bacterium]
MEPIFLSVQDVLDLHARTIARHGGALGVRNLGLLESAVALPRQSFDGRYVHDDLAAMAAAYLFHIASNHPFVDGNKRAGLAACLAFLLANGAELPWSPAELTTVTLDVAAGRVDKPTLTAWLRTGLSSG